MSTDNKSAMIGNKNNYTRSNNTLLVCIAVVSMLATWTTLVACNEPKVEIHNTFQPEACSRKAKPTDMLKLHYKGALENGEVFDTSYGNEPFQFQLGTGQVIKGWEKGLLGVCVGEKRKLVIPPELGYGDSPHDKIPAKSTLVFEVEVLEINDGPAPVNIFKEIDTDGDKRLTRKEVSEFLKKQLAEASKFGDAGTGDETEHRQMVEEIFSHEDRNKDGEISIDEFSGPKIDHDEL